jgi:hypothetical protein
MSFQFCTWPVQRIARIDRAIRAITERAPPLKRLGSTELSRDSPMNWS